MTDPIEMMDVLWSEGKHSLCMQVNGQPFKAIGQFDNALEMFSVAAKLPPEANVWWGVHGMEPPAKGRGGVEHVVQVATLCADFDWADADAHKQAVLPPEKIVRRIVAEMDPKPTVVVDSGHGLQAYWGLVDPLDRDEGQRLSEGFFRHIERKYKLRNDRIDLASILRLPGSTNNKATPKPVRIEYVDPESGYYSEYLFENCWEPEPRSEPPAAPSVLPIAQLVDVSRGTHDDSPWEWLASNFDSYACAQRLGWQPGPRRGDEEQMTRPHKDPRLGTSGTFHHDTGAMNTYSKTLDAIYAQVCQPHRGGGVTVTVKDWWMIENGITDRSDAARAIRQLMPAREPRAVVEAAPGSTGQVTPAAMQQPPADASVEHNDAGESFIPIDLSGYLDGTMEQPQPTLLAAHREDLTQHLLYGGMVNGVHGDSGSGKSWIGMKLLSERMQCGETVMLIDLEDTPSSIVSRLTMMGVKPDTIMDQLVYIRPMEQFLPAEMAKMIAMIAERNITVVVIDSLGEAFGLEGINEDRDNEVGPWLKGVARVLAEAGPAVLLVDHSTKSAENPLHPSGSKRKRAAIGGASYLVEAMKPFVKGEGGRVRLTCAKDRHGNYRRGDHVADVEMICNWDGTMLIKMHLADSTAPAVDPVDRLREGILTVLSKEEEPCTNYALRGLLSEARVKFSNSNLGPTLAVMAMRGELIEEEGTRNSKRYSIPPVRGS